MKNIKLGFIGAGVMGKAIMKGLVGSNFLPKENILVSEISQVNAQKAAVELGVNVISDNKKLTDSCDYIILCTKPFIIKEVLEEIKHNLTQEKTVISIAAGVSTEAMEGCLRNKNAVIRVMPNTPAVVGEGMTAICKGKYVKDDQLNFVMQVFSKVGRAIEVPEKLINAVTGISGSGPAFMYLIIEALADGGVKLGLPKQTALELAAQTVLGAAKTVLETGKHPSVLKDEVTTPGGCTIAGLLTLEENNVRHALSKTVQETAKTAAGLGS